MNPIRLVTPITNETLDALKLAALYFPRIQIEKSVFILAQPHGRTPDGQTTGTVIDKLIFPDDQFLSTTKPLLDAGILEVASKAARDGLGDQWDEIAKNASRLLDKHVSSLFRIDRPKGEPDQRIASVEMNAETFQVHERYFGPLRAAGHTFHYGLLLSYYSALLADVLANASFSNVPTTESQVLNALIQQAGQDDAFQAFSEKMRRLDGIVPQIAQGLLRVSLPDICLFGFDDILDVRHHLSEVLHRFHEEVARLSFQAINEWVESDGNVNVNNVVRFRIQPFLDELERKAKGSKLRVLKLFLQALKNPKSYVPFVGSVLHQIPAQVAFFLSLGMMAVDTALDYFKDRQDINANGLYFLVGVPHMLRRRRRHIADATLPARNPLISCKEGVLVPHWDITEAGPPRGDK